LDHLLFWNAADLQRKLELYARYYNGLRVHQGLDGDTPEEKAGRARPEPIGLEDYIWKRHCTACSNYQSPLECQFTKYRLKLAAVHRAYAKRAQVTVASLGNWPRSSLPTPSSVGSVFWLPKSGPL
jgi:hypothetical protein